MASKKCPKRFPLLLAGLVLAVSAQAQEGGTVPLAGEPIAFIGHGVAYDHQGREIEPTVDFLLEAQSYYIAELSSLLTAEELSQYTDLRRRLLDRWEKIRGQSDVLSLGHQQLLVHGVLLDALLDLYNPADHGRLRGINGLMKSTAIAPLAGLPAEEQAQLLERFPLFQLLREFDDAEAAQPFLLTLNGGAAYIAECAANGVPTPPDWGSASWVSTGSLPNANEFISRNREARPHVYRSTSPVGACIALPRVDTSRNVITLLGIICVGKQSGKACFWDNQEFVSGDPTPNSFDIPVGQSLPLSDFLGGADLNGGEGGECTVCHAGENPYVLHPRTPLGHADTTGSTANTLDQSGTLETMPTRFYEPIAHPSWYQNEFASTLVDTTEGAACSGCHGGAGSGTVSNYVGGRLPKLSTDLRSGYCLNVIKNAINIATTTDPDNTMPPGTILSSTDHASLVAVINDFCDNNTDPGKSTGDPHLQTTDGVNYDFHAAGDFVLLQGGGGFEVQTRQAAIPTTFFPGANAHTEVASCVSVNTALAARVSNHRVTFQSSLDGSADPAGMELRIDGVLTPLTAAGVTLPTGGRVKKSGADGLEIEFPNGEWLTAIPGYWASQDQWLLNVSIAGAEANRGIMGSIPAGSWLPKLPDGSSVGPKPSSEAERYAVLNGTFADAWRVDNASSLFDYGPGLSTDSFGLPGWPKDSPDCVVPDKAPTPPASRAEAVQACRVIEDADDRRNCEFDFELTGAEVFVDLYSRTEQALRWSTSTTIGIVQGAAAAPGDRVYVVSVEPRWPGLTRQPTGTVQVMVGGQPFGDPQELDANAHVFVDGADIGDQEVDISAIFTPGAGSDYLPDASAEIYTGSLASFEPGPERPSRGVLWLIISLLLLLVLVLLVLLLKRSA